MTSTEFFFPLLTFFLCPVTLCPGGRHKWQLEQLICSTARPFCEVIQLADPTENDPFVFLAGLGSWVGSWGSHKWRAHSSGIVGVREGTQPSPFGSSVPMSPSSLDFPWVMAACCDLNHLSDTPRQEQPFFYTGKCQFVHPVTNSPHFRFLCWWGALLCLLACLFVSLFLLEEYLK